ncbi:tRNA (adenine(22)-N(1))-methyltransferase [Salirhabdus salicampi]|uniref:tRNA (adenine(22)-N(1))-methyltransferase n=1 Tax=Salirhabdus salicampi TaxID=476102 RepID=UPI0020C1F57A|nr:tRNA (adenine(22)-N(1))-methyltransferase TrmK [Salirhabdus salicampi]
MDTIHLSSRLRYVANYIPSGATFADIGSDHAYLPCYVCLRDEKAKAIAGELNEGPYQSALQQVKKQQLTDRIDVRKGDGLSVIQPNEVDTVVIAGMGGTLIKNILHDGRHRIHNVKRIIAQPNVDARSVRKWLYSHHYRLVDEKIIEEDGYYYEILVAEQQAGESKSLTEKEYYLGPFLIENKDPAFVAKWKEVIPKKERVIQNMRKAKQPDTEKIQAFVQELTWIKEEIGNDS